MTSTNNSPPGDEPQRKTYKEQLDEAAIKAQNPESDKPQGGIVNTVIEKVSQYVPAVGKALGQGPKESTPTQPGSQVPGPPERPHHDVQIEEFVRDQHCSKADGDGKSTTE